MPNMHLQFLFISIIYTSIFFTYVHTQSASEIWPVRASARFIYNYTGTTTCDLTQAPCAPLTDVWGVALIHNQTQGVLSPNFGLVGLVNGIDVIDLTNKLSPKRIDGFIRSCLSEDRFIEAFYAMSYPNEVAYSVSNYSPLCQCNVTNCSLQIVFDTPPAPSSLGVVQISIARPLADAGVTKGKVVYGSPSDGCSAPATDLTGQVWVVNKGNCSFGRKILFGQQANANAVIIINDRNDIIYSKQVLWMGDSPQQITIPAVLVSMYNSTFLQNLPSGTYVTLDPTNLQDSTLYSTPGGLTIIDLAQLPFNGRPVLHGHRLDWFNFAAKMNIDPPSPVLYVVGTDTNFGGLTILDLTDPLNPVMLSQWNTGGGGVLNSVATANCSTTNRRLLFASSSENSTIYIMDVSDPTNPMLIYNITTDYEPHEAYPSPDCSHLYVVYSVPGTPASAYDISGISNPTASSPVTHIHFYQPTNLSTIPMEISVKNNFLYITDAGLVVFNIQDPHNPILTASTPTNSFESACGIYARSARAVFVADTINGLYELAFDKVQQVTMSATTGQGKGPMTAAVTLSMILLAGTFAAFAYFRVYHFKA